MILFALVNKGTDVPGIPKDARKEKFEKNENLLQALMFDGQSRGQNSTGAQQESASVLQQYPVMKCVRNQVAKWDEKFFLSSCEVSERLCERSS